MIRQTGRVKESKRAAFLIGRTGKIRRSSGRLTAFLSKTSAALLRIAAADKPGSGGALRRSFETAHLFQQPTAPLQENID